MDKMAVQINGLLETTVPKDTSISEVLEILKEKLSGLVLVKIQHVPRKLINIVVRQV